MKKSLIFSLIVMALCIVVGVVGVTAAWFGNITKQNDKVVITSYAPSGNATMSIDSTSSFGAGDGLTPAIATESYLLAVEDGKLDLDSFDVLHSSKYISQVATQVTMDFDFVYAGTADPNSSTKTIDIKLDSVTIENPRKFIPIAQYVGEYDKTMRYIYSNGTYIQDDNGDYIKVFSTAGLVDYKAEFVFTMTLAKYLREETTYHSSYTYYTRTGQGRDGFTEVPQAQRPQSDSDIQSGSYYFVDSRNNSPWNHWTYDQINSYTLRINTYPRVEARFLFTVNFARVDEEVNPLLMDTTLFFNFMIYTV